MATDGQGKGQGRTICLACPCGEMLTADDEDQLVEKANAHLAAEHPNLAGLYTRDQILAMAY
jgi:hypothetical protein